MKTIHLLPLFVVLIGVVGLCGCRSSSTTGSNDPVKVTADFAAEAKSDFPLQEEYADDDYGFQFRYPENWEIMKKIMGAQVIAREIPVGDVTFVQNANVVVTPADPDLPNIKKNKMIQMIQKRYANINVTNFEIGEFLGKKAIRLRFEGTMKNETNPVAPTIPLVLTQYFSNHDDKLFVITFSNSLENEAKNPKAREIEAAILASFRFPETTKQEDQQEKAETP